MKFRVYIENSFDPFSHLELEKKFLYEDKDIGSSPILFFYRNKPSVIFGNFQNPWIEANIPFCIENNILLVRRFSGGGCVYHDIGNLNICFIGKKDNSSKRVLTGLLQNYLKKDFSEISVGHRSDIYYKGHKVSGSAFRETKDRTLHHLTLLMFSDLNNLSKSLTSPMFNYVKKSLSIPSRRSMVVNLYEGKTSEFVQEWIESFCSFYHFPVPVVINDSHEMLKLPNLEDVFSKTPRFFLEGDNWFCDIDKGILGNLRSHDYEYSDINIRLPCKKDELKHLKIDHRLINQWQEWGLIHTLKD